MINNFFTTTTTTTSSSSFSATQPAALDPPPETSMTDRAARATAKRGLDANILDMYRDEMQEYFSHQDRAEVATSSQQRGPGDGVHASGVEGGKQMGRDYLLVEEL
jgi:hypothetical protein